jgi:hypothetical protein
MSVTARLAALICLLFVVSAIVLAQKNDPEARAAVAGGAAQFATKAPMNVHRFEPLQLTIGSGTVLDATTGRAIGNTGFGESNVQSNSATTPSLVPIATFDGSFVAQGGPSEGRVFPFTMIGGQPSAGKTTTIPAPISEVSLTLLNADGSVLTTVSFDPFEALTLQSPNFNTTNYRSGNQIQFTDAIQRAEFFNSMASNWHTVLQPSVVNRVNIAVPRFVNVQLSPGHVIQARSYFIGTAADGKTFVLMLNLVFDFFFGNEVNNEINLGNFTTNALNMTLFPNTYLFALNANKPDTPGTCCVLGFHTFFFDPSASPATRWVTQYASWISPGIFGGGFEDVTGLSHETSEAFNDPFLDNPTPSWQFPGVSAPALSAQARVCQNNLETADPVEVLPTATVPITLQENGQPFTYHPQTNALFEWFEMGPSSNAIDGAFSFPDETALAQSAIPCPK